ncbi:4-GalTase 1) (Beta4Gal-T1) (b4Gal-T1) (Beta-N-acetylglucosaminyl-glycolipid beta-1 [Durusdinium trenchii]|uniref:4-GalTase 1) (Beta4Gal-T1) (B4Gal-T1) (Beta-N-acetylglucosaminyl-glycolipid beta-1 n=1 Tax=Durusdinium trenchii TaxID=1381693 RepID=A0ABP0JG54_9DINO
MDQQTGNGAPVPRAPATMASADAKQPEEEQGRAPEDKAKLPPGWTREFSKSQKREYFFHVESGKSVWSLADLERVRSSSAGGATKRNREETQDGAQAKKSKKEGRRVAIIVPFRDLHKAQRRKEHLDKFVPHMSKYLAGIPGIAEFHVFVVEQSDDKRKFNRGKLLNIGFQLARQDPREFDAFVFHDVDLLPQKPLEEWYAKAPHAPLHLARAWGRYNNNPKYFGGIVTFCARDFERIDGFPNTFWGWGGEDDEILLRVQQAGLRIDGPSKHLRGAVVDLEGMDAKTKLDFLRKTDWKCKVKWEVLDEYKALRGEIAEGKKPRPPWWGLRGTTFKKLSESSLGEHATRILVDVGYNSNADGSEHWANRKLDWK